MGDNSLDLMAQKVVSKARDAFLSGKTRSIGFRKRQLNALFRMVEDNTDQIVEALYKDLKKPKQECMVVEVEYVLNDIRMMLYNIDEWAKPTPVPKNMVLILDDPYIISEPYGVVLVLGPWNYPLQLALAPFVGAVTAGNTVVLKPSELSPATSELLATLIPKYLDQECYHVFTGGAEEAQALLRLKFDYIFYTGSTAVGKLVYQAATRHLTPVTLELGGKCPTYIADDANLEITAKRMLWGKMLNAGQTCIAPDYVLTSERTRDRLLAVIADTLRSFYGDLDPINSPDFGRIISDKHIARLEGLLASTRGTVALGGRVNAAERYVAPTFVTDVTPDDPLMKEEIFGPILPIITVKNEEEAIDIINRGEKPLSLYIFSSSSKLIKNFVEHTSSGSVCVNDSIVHLSILELPFGGVGHSGFGKYHGKASFDAFSHAKSVLRRSFTPIGEMLGKGRYPPYSMRKVDTLNLLLKRRQNLVPDWAGSLILFLLGVGAAIVLHILLRALGGDSYLPRILQ